MIISENKKSLILFNQTPAGIFPLGREDEGREGKGDFVQASSARGGRPGAAGKSIAGGTARGVVGGQMVL